MQRHDTDPHPSIWAAKMGDFFLKADSGDVRAPPHTSLAQGLGGAFLGVK